MSNIIFITHVLYMKPIDFSVTKLNTYLTRGGNRQVRMEATNIEYPYVLLNPYLEATEAAGI